MTSSRHSEGDGNMSLQEGSPRRKDSTPPRSLSNVNVGGNAGSSSSPNDSTPRSRTSSSQTSEGVATPTTSLFDRTVTEATPKVTSSSPSSSSRPSQRNILPEQSTSPETIKSHEDAERGLESAPGTASSPLIGQQDPSGAAQRDLNAARAALEDVHLTPANLEHRRGSESSTGLYRNNSASRPNSAISTSGSSSALASIGASSISRNASPTSSHNRPPPPPRRRSSASQASTSSRRGSLAGSAIASETSRRLSVASNSSHHHSSPWISGVGAGGGSGPDDWTRTDVQHSPVAEGDVLQSTDSIPSDRRPTPASSSSSIKSNSGGLHASNSSLSAMNTDAVTTTTRIAETSKAVIVRDFAYPRQDPRFCGEHVESQVGSGGDSSSRLSRMSGMLDSPAVGNEAFGSSGSSAFSWGFVTSHATDFNTSEDDSQLYSEDDTSSRSDFDYNGSASGEHQGLGAFVPGIYSAMYDFMPELETEMAITTGEMVTVFSRQCAGWVQAARVKDGNVTGEVGLVPENYLSLVEESEFTGPDWNDETPMANDDDVNSYEASWQGQNDTENHEVNSSHQAGQPSISFLESGSAIIDDEEEEGEGAEGKKAAKMRVAHEVDGERRSNSSSSTTDQEIHGKTYTTEA